MLVKDGLGSSDDIAEEFSVDSGNHDPDDFRSSLAEAGSGLVALVPHLFGGLFHGFPGRFLDSFTA